MRKYIERSNFVALVQHAIASRDQSDIDLARLYVYRCGILNLKPQNASAPTKRSPVIERELEALLNSCAGMYAGVDRQLVAALKQAEERLGKSNANVEQPLAELRDAMLRGDSEIVLEKLASAPLASFRSYLISVGAWRESFDNVPPEVAVSYFQFMFKSTVCEQIGCDAGYWMVFNCQFLGECSQTTLQDQNQSIISKLRVGVAALQATKIDIDQVETELAASVARGVQQLQLVPP